MLNINKYKIKIKYEEFLTHPALTAVFVVLFFGLSFARLPAVFQMLMLAVEVYIAMFFGARFACPGNGKSAPATSYSSGESS